MISMFEYPALYETAGEMSDQSQNLTLNLVKSEYFLLFISAIMSMNWSKSPTYFSIYACILLGSLGLLVKRTTEKPEKGWYRGRALAESIKTSCWRFCMRAEPFGNGQSVNQANLEFQKHLLEILHANRSIGDRMPPDSSAKEQIPDSMREVRQLNLNDRKTFYLIYRINEQRNWYRNKAKYNKKLGKIWAILGIFAYVLAIGLAISRISFPNWEMWPIDPVIVLASAIIGWTNLKKFNELASSYALTAHEIGIIKSRVSSISSENDFSDFVNEAEQAFSREHTQWVARQQS